MRMSINVGRRGRSRHSAASATGVGAGKSQYPESFLRCRPLDGGHSGRSVKSSIDRYCTTYYCDEGIAVYAVDD